MEEPSDDNPQSIDTMSFEELKLYCCTLRLQVKQFKQEKEEETRKSVFYEFQSTDIERKELIGIGGFAHIYKCHILSSEKFPDLVGKNLAMKELYGTTADNYEIAKNSFSMELQLLQKLQHPNIVTFVGFHRTPTSFFLVMYQYSGTLRKIFLQKRVNNHWISSDLIADCFMKILFGLAYLHSQRIAHRDLKGDNILVNVIDDLEISSIHIADFGIAKILKQIENKHTAVGTMSFMAPQVLSTKYNPFKADIWSCGILLYEMITSELPPQQTSQPLPTGFNKKIENEPKYKLLEDIYQKCNNEEENLRPSARQLYLYLKWFSQWKTVYSK